MASAQFWQTGWSAERKEPDPVRRPRHDLGPSFGRFSRTGSLERAGRSSRSAGHRRADPLELCRYRPGGSDAARRNASQRQRGPGRRPHRRFRDSFLLGTRQGQETSRAGRRTAGRAGHDRARNHRA